MHHGRRARSDAQADGPSPTGYPPGAKVGTLPAATSLHFGVLLSGPGAVDLAQPRFETVGADVPVTSKPSPPLPDEPQALNFGQPAAT